MSPVRDVALTISYNKRNVLSQHSNHRRDVAEKNTHASHLAHQHSPPSACPDYFGSLMTNGAATKKSLQ